jgi:Fe-S cluster assembly protein SufD
MTLAHDTYPDQMEGLLAAAEGRTGEGPSWLREVRRKALASFRESGVPSMAQEEWKYTNLREIAARSWTVSEPGPAVFSFHLPFVCPKSIRVVLVNGQFDRNLSEITPVPGLTVASLATSLAEHEALLQENLGRVAKAENHPFAALNTALFHDGVFIHVGRGVEVPDVIEIVHIASGSGMVIAPRILILAEDGSRVKITESYISEADASSLVVPVTEVKVGRDASVEMVRLQDEGLSSHHIGLWEGLTSAGSEYLAYNVAFGGQLHRLDQNITIAGEHAQIRLDGVAAADGKQVIDNHTRLDHAVPNCSSFEVYKQIVDDEATVIFNGKIFVHQDAQKTDAKQTNQALLLSPNATINSKPQLEIFADDVKCTHGATVGQLEEAPLFYMMSRGMPRKQAEAMLVYAFAAEVLELISIHEVKKRLEDRLFAKLNTAESL